MAVISASTSTSGRIVHSTTPHPPIDTVNSSTVCGRVWTWITDLVETILSFCEAICNLFYVIICCPCCTPELSPYEEAAATPLEQSVVLARGVERAKVIADVGMHALLIKESSTVHDNNTLAYLIDELIQTCDMLDAQLASGRQQIATFEVEISRQGEGASYPCKTLFTYSPGHDVTARIAVRQALLGSYGAFLKEVFTQLNQADTFTARVDMRTVFVRLDGIKVASFTRETISTYEKNQWTGGTIQCVPSFSSSSSKMEALAVTRAAARRVFIAELNSLVGGTFRLDEVFDDSGALRLLAVTQPLALTASA